MLVLDTTWIALLRPYLTFAAESEGVRCFQNETRKLLDKPVERRLLEVKKKGKKIERFIQSTDPISGSPPLFPFDNLRLWTID